MKPTILNFPDRRTIEAEAGAWLIRLDGDEALSAEERQELEAWLARSPAHGRELRSLAGFWGRANVLTELAIPLDEPASESRRTRVAREGMRRRRVGPVSMVAGLAGAALVAAITVLIATDLSFGTNSGSAGTAADSGGDGHYATAIGQQRTITLADGSVARLNTNTRLSVEYGERYRDIRLQAGEAHFTVVPNGDRPFRVYAGNGLIQATGTAFAVHIRDGDVDVLVTEGSVEIATTGNSRQPAGLLGDDPAIDALQVLGTLRVGQQATIRRSGERYGAIDEIRTVEPIEIEKKLGWRDGLLTFAGDPLGQVVAEISRYTTVTVDIPDPEVRAIRIGGRIAVGETDAMIAALETNFGLRVTRIGPDRIEITADK